VAMTVGPGEGGDDELVASITHAAGDVMLVLLIIFPDSRFRW